MFQSWVKPQHLRQKDTSLYSYSLVPLFAVSFYGLTFVSSFHQTEGDVGQAAIPAWFSGFLLGLLQNRPGGGEVRFGPSGPGGGGAGFFFVTTRYC